MIYIFVAYIVCIVVLIVAAYWDFVWGWFGLFFYHTEVEEGHMHAYLGVRHYLKLFGKRWTWVTK